MTKKNLRGGKGKDASFEQDPAVTGSLEASLQQRMVIVSKYTLIEKEPGSTFFVRSAEQVAAPCCGGSLCVVGSRPRIWFKSSGEKVKLIIRRLYCDSCRRIHHELPDLLVPYKHYDAESIEGAVSEPPRTDIAADDSTIARWKRWFPDWAVYAAGCLQALAIRFNLPVASPSTRPQSALQWLGRFVGDAAG